MKNRTNTIKVITSHGCAELRSQTYRVIIMRSKGYMHVRVYALTYAHRGPFTRKCLSNVKDGLTHFELKSTVLHFYRLAREHGPDININNVNYAEIFGSCFD